MSILQKRSQTAGTGILYSGGRWKIDGATQANQEAETTNKVVTSDVQHFGPSAAKAWAAISVSAGTPTLNASYNVTSITDTALGRVTITIATDFSSANFASIWTADSGGAGGVNSFYSFSIAAGAVVCQYIAAGASADPANWSWVGFGDHA